MPAVFLQRHTDSLIRVASQKLASSGARLWRALPRFCELGAFLHLLLHAASGACSTRHRARSCSIFIAPECETRNCIQDSQTGKDTDLSPLAAPLSLQTVAADFGTFFGSSDDTADHLHHLLANTLRKELPWLSVQAQARTLGILLLLPHIQEVRLLPCACLDTHPVHSQVQNT